MDDNSSEDIVFYGREGESCEGFIRAVRKVGFKAGKFRDDAWMADFAATCLDGPALRFYETLSPDVRGDWNLLRQALLLKYPLPGQAGATTVTANPSLSHVIPAAAPAAALPPQPRKGRIKVIGENSTGFSYLGDGYVGITGSYLGAGASLSDALLVSYTPAGKLCEIEIKRQGGRNQVLGLHWISPSPAARTGSPDCYAGLTAFNCEGSHRSSTMAWRGPGYTTVWTVMPDNTVCAYLGDDNSCSALRTFKYDNGDSGRFAIDMAADAEAFEGKWGSSWKPVKLMLEEIS